MIKRIFKKIFKKKETVCDVCGRNATDGVIYCNYNICSMECMCRFFKNMTTEELIESNKKDKTWRL